MIKPHYPPLLKIEINYIRIVVIVVILMVIPRLYGQPNETLQKFVEKYKTNDAVIKESITTVNFSFKKNTQTIEVNKEVVLYVLSLRANNTVTFGINYDNNSEIINVKAPGKKLNEICGDFRPDWVFHSDDKICTYTFSLNGLGETQTFLFQKYYNDVRYYTAQYFTERYPVIKSTIRFIVPDGFDVEFKNFNTDEFAFKTNQEYNINDKTTTIEYQCENLPGYEDKETNVPQKSFVFAHILIIPKSYQNKGTKIRIFATLNDFYQWCKSMTDNTLNETNLIKPLINKLTEGKSSDIEKIKAIYYWVQENIRYIAFEEGLKGYIPENAEKVYLQKYGDCKGMANLLKTMLRLAGYDGRLSWVGTSDIRYDFSSPTLATCNHMVCALFLNGKHYILDATDSYIPFGEYSYRLQGRQLLIEDGEHYILDTIPVSKSEANITFSSYHFDIFDEILKGDVALSFYGAMKYSLLYQLNNIRSDDRQKLLEKIVKRDESKITVTNLTSSDIHNREETLLIKSEIAVKGNITSFDNEIYIIPDPFEDILDFITNDDRQNPLELGKDNDRKTEIIIHFPENYRVLKMPNNYLFSNDLIRFQMDYIIDGHSLKYTKQIKTIERIISKNRLQEWNNSLKQIKKAWSQPIVLQKI